MDPQSRVHISCGLNTFFGMQWPISTNYIDFQCQFAIGRDLFAGNQIFSNAIQVHNAYPNAVYLYRLQVKQAFTF